MTGKLPSSPSVDRGVQARQPAAEAAAANVYAPPAAAPPVPASNEARRQRNRAFLALSLGVVGPIPFFVLAAAVDAAWPVTLAFVVTVACGMVVVASATRAMLAQKALGTSSVASRIGDGFLVFSGVCMSAFGALLAFLSTMSFSRGRQIRTLGKTLLPPVAPGSRWLTAEVATPGVPEGETRRALAEQWRENGRTEHASVAAFAQLTLELVALGAPPDLVAAAQRDALDEIRHAELCFSLARAIDGNEASPGAFPAAARAARPSRMRAVALAELAVSSLVDGAMNEGVSARIVARLGKRCEDPAIRAVLREIAADEGRHAAHGWDVVRFCLAEGGAPVAHALAGAVRALPRSLTSTLAPASRGGAWQRWGIPGEALEAEELAKTRADVVRRVAALLAPYDVALAA